MNLAQTSIENTEEDETENEYDIQKMLVFICGDQHFAIDIMSVREIIKPVVLTRLPNVPKFVYGITNLRGNIIPILHLGFRLGDKDIAITKNMRYIVVEGKGKMFGLIVDSIKQVAGVLENDFQDPSHHLSDIDQEFVKNYFSIDETIIIQLDVDQLLNKESP